MPDTHTHPHPLPPTHPTAKPVPAGPAAHDGLLLLPHPAPGRGGRLHGRVRPGRLERRVQVGHRQCGRRPDWCAWGVGVGRRARPRVRRAGLVVGVRCAPWHARSPCLSTRARTRARAARPPRPGLPLSSRLTPLFFFSLSLSPGSHRPRLLVHRRLHRPVGPRPHPVYGLHRDDGHAGHPGRDLPDPRPAARLGPLRLALGFPRPVLGHLLLRQLWGEFLGRGRRG